MAPTSIEFTDPAQIIPALKDNLGAFLRPQVLSRVIVNLRPDGMDVVRADDLLVLSFDFTNFKLDNGQFNRVNTGPALLQITFQPQSFAESAFTVMDNGTVVNVVNDDGTVTTTTPPVKCAMANPSQIAFDVPETVKSIPLDALTNLLDWSKYQLRVAARGLDAGPNRGPADDTVTLIEAPYGLILTPDSSATWSHSGWPVEQNSVTELWHSILNADKETSKLAAIFAGDGQSKFSGGALPWKDRNQLTQQSSVGTGAIQSRRFMLSSLGAFLDLHGEWPDPSKILEWEHRATMGRDHYVRLVANGYLYPFGHRACQVSITERRLTAWNKNAPPADDGGPLYLLTRTYLVVRERMRAYPVHQIPFYKVECLTRVTPDLDPHDPNASSTWPRVNGNDFLFHFVGTDVAGHETSFTSPVIFVEAGAGDDSVTTEFRKRPGSNLGGQPVAYGDASASTVLHTLAMSFNGTFTGVDALQRVTPSMVDAEVRVPAVTHLLGSDQPRKIRLSDNFTQQQTTGKAHDLSVFAQFIDNDNKNNPIDFKFSSNDQSGGLLQPHMQLGSLSHTNGPMGRVACRLHRYLGFCAILR